ncbi:MAG TPA: efflux RND transporter periplasmic adaptor subunit [Polyangia bacterium]|jgi:RND family efflux transporter MFP subunit|nr:efflux RND transporter periplasmic adaptor subunit [Polyangia bacterium]
MNERSDPLSSDLASLRIQRDENPDRPRPLRWVLVVLLLVGAAVAGYVFGLPYVEAKVFKTPVAFSEISLVSPAEASTELTATGYVMPLVVTHVGVKVQGRVAKVFVKEGELVKAGQVLFQLEDLDQRTALGTSEARVQAARARAELARANAEEFRTQLERAKKLADRGAGTTSAAEDLTLRVRALGESARVAEAEARVAATEREQTEVALRNTIIRAPISGKVLNKPPEVGELVGPISGAVAGVSVDVADFTSLVMEVDVPEGRLHLVRVGAPCEIALDAFPDRRLRGAVKEVTPRVNRSKATVTVRVSFVDPPEGVLPDMAGRVGFLSKALDEKAVREKPKLVLPGNAVTERAGQKVVFTVDASADDQVRMVPVKLGAPFGSGFELVEGPPAGTKVVRDPPETLREGNPVKEKSE